MTRGLWAVGVRWLAIVLRMRLNGAGGALFRHKPLTLLSLVVLAACSASDGGPPPPSESVGDQRAALCTQTTISASPASPIALNGTTRLTATASCGTAAPEYRFLWQLPGSNGTTYGFINDWSSSNFVDWDTTNFNGAYNIYAYSRSVGGTNQESSAVLGPFLIGKVCGSTSFTVSPAPVAGTSPPRGTQLSFTPTSTCSFGGTPEYQFYYMPVGSPTPQYVQILAPNALPNSWSATPPVFDTTNLPAGKYTVYARARAQGNASVLESYAYGPANLYIGDVCPSTALSASPASPQPTGRTINITANATCIRTAVPEYRFSFKKVTDGGWSFLGDFSTNPTFAWDTTGLPPGAYQLQVYTRGVGNLSPTEGYNIIGFTLSPDTCASDGDCRAGRYCSQAGECRVIGATCSTNAMCGAGQSCQDSQCACPAPANGCQLNGGPAPTLAELKAGFPNLQYRPVTYARDTDDYFVLPTLAPWPVIPVTQELKRANHFIFNVPSSRQLSLTFNVGNSAAPGNPSLDFVLYNAAGVVIRMAPITSAYPGYRQTVLALGTLAAGNYEFDVVPRDPALTYTVASDYYVPLAFKGGADLPAGMVTSFFVPAETETAFLVGAFDPATPVQFASPDGAAVTPQAITPQVYAINTGGKPGVWKTKFRTTSSRAHFINLPDVFSIDIDQNLQATNLNPNVIVSKRIRTAMSSSTGGSATNVVSPTLRFSNRFAFHVSSASSPAFNISSSATPPLTHMSVNLIDSNGVHQTGSPFDVTPGVSKIINPALQVGDYELHVNNPALVNTYTVTVPPNVPFVSVDGYGLGDPWFSTNRAYFTVPPGVSTISFVGKPIAPHPVEVYNPAGVLQPQPISRINNLYEIPNATPGTWSINLQGSSPSDIRFLNVPQIISFNSTLHGTPAPGGITTCTTNANCPSGQVCGTDNGARFGLAPTADVCWLTTCGTPQAPANSCGSTLSECGNCTVNPCANGVRDLTETDVDCGGDCADCASGKVCSADTDCATGLACGVNNGGYFGLPRSTRVCWSAGPCSDGVDSSECGTDTSVCGKNCGGATICDPANPACPDGEVCKTGIDQLFGVDASGVCVDPICPSNDPTQCGTEASLCGKECICTPNCSGATAANPSDGCDGVCPHVCPDGQPCCSLDLHCSVGSTCQAQASGSGICRPGGCAFQVLAPPLCGSPNAPCGAQCPACTAECGARQCGVDPACGTSCGTCDAGLYCTWEGQCAPSGGGREPVQVPNGTGGVVPLPDLPEGPTSAVGAVAGQFSVSDQGTAQYNVPIDVPPGRAGVEPALSLRYSATRASGEAGVGWKLEGLSQITRCPRVYALDGYSAPVANNSTDRFCIDGKRLETIAGSAQYGAEGAEYRTLVDTFTKVISHVDQGEGHQHAPLAGILRLIRDQQGPDYFTVSMKDGRILTYGRTRDSLLMGQNGVRVSWLLNKVEDRAGNTMKVRYTNLRASLPAEGADGVPNLVKPEAISYTGHGEVDGTREVRFDYERRLDGQLSFAQGGTPLIVAHRLHRVMTFADKVPVKNYRLEYADETHSQLTKVFECIRDADEKCKAPTEFTYEKESGFTQAENGPSITGAGQLDVNGDGLTDFLVTTAHVGDMPANTGLKAGFITADVALGVGTYVYLTPVGGLAVNAVWGLLKGPLYGFLADKPKVTFTTDLLKGMGSRANPVDYVANVTGLTCPTAVSFFADYDQDGRDDVISLCSPDALSVFRSLGDGNFGSFPSSEPVATLPGQTPPFTLPVVPPPLLYDVNGDSLQDVVSCRDPSTLEVRLRPSPGEVFQSAPIVLRGELGWSGPQGIRARVPYCATAVPTHQILDVDGDGTPELVARFGATGIEKLQVGAESGWFALRFAPAGSSAQLSWQLINFPDTGKSSQGKDMLVADLNGDGLNDVWRPDGPEATIWLNTGGRFLARTIPRPRPALFPGTKLDYSAIADYNSDGRLDILEHWTDTECTKPNAPADCFEEQFNVALRPDGAVSFLEAGLAPDLTWRSTSTTTVSAGVFSTVGDLDGDGNADLFGRNGQVFFGSGVHNMLLSSVKDGLGNVIHVRYDANSPYKATCSEGTQWPERCLKTMKGLVSGHSEGFTDPSGFNGEVVERNYSYTYENARMNVTGHGWLGFDRRSVTETVQGQGRTVTTEFTPVTRYTPAGSVTGGSTPPYLYPLAGLPRSVIIDQGPTLGGDVTQSPLEDAPHSRRTRITNSWRVQSSADGRPFPVLNRARTETFSRRVPEPFNDVPFAEDGDLRTTCVSLNESIDGYGNVGFNNAYCEAPELEARIESVLTRTTFQPNRTQWLISNPELITVTAERERTASSSDSQTQVVDPEYDSLGFLHAVTRDPSGERQRSTYTRDEFGNVTRIVEDVGTGEAARITNVTYDADNIFPRTVTNAKGHTSQLTFDSKYGQVATVVDPNGIATQRSYDAFGKVSRTVGPSGTSEFDYASLPVGSSQTDAGTIYPRLQLTVASTGVEGSVGGRSQQQFDNYGRVVRSETVGFNGAPVVSEQAYDARGRVTGATLPHLAGVLAPTTAYQYDYLHRVTQVAHSDGTYSERQYASGVSLAPAYQKWLGGLSCRVPTLTRCAVDIELSIDTHAPGEAGKQNVVIKDHAGLVVRSIDGENVDTVARTSNYDYAAFNRLQQMRDNANAVTVFNHDPYGRLKVHVDPDAGVAQYTYNGFGEVSTSLDPKQQLRTYTYDVLGRLETIVDPAGTTRWIYDQGVSALGQLSESISPPTLESPAGQHVLYSYEAATPTHHRGLVQTITYAIDSAAYAIDMHYDDLARIDTVDYPNTGSGAPIRAKYNYDTSSGALVGLAEIGSGTPRPVWRIDAAFQGHLVEQETFGNGAVSTLSYDPDRRWLDSVRTKLGTDTIQSLDYSHYDNGQVHERLSPGLDQEYAYDPLGRLRTITEARSGFPTALKEFRYDAHGNLTQKHGVTNVYSPSYRHLPDTVGANTYTHDANGNLKSRFGPDVPGGTQTIEYTPFDLPKQVVTGTGTTRTTQFDYTADGTRVVRRDATTTQHFASSLYHRVLSTSGGSTLEEHFRLFPGAGTVAEIVRKPGSETTLYFHPDHLGTPDTISDGNLNVTHQEFGPFGDLIGVPPSINGNSTRIGFTGHQQDNDIGFTDMGGRVYDSLAGRFTTADPVMQAPFWSQGQNRYAYVFNDPINATDPSGFMSDSEIAGGSAPGIIGGSITGGTLLAGIRGASGSVGGTFGTMGGSMLHTMLLTPGGPPANTTFQVAAPSAAPTSTLNKANGMGDATSAARLPGPMVKERPPGLSLFDPEAGALACNGGGDVCIEIQRQRTAALQAEMNKKIEVIEALEWELFWAYTGGKVLKVGVAAFRAWRLSRAIVAVRTSTVAARTLGGTVGEPASKAVTEVITGKAPLDSLTTQVRGRAAAFYRDVATRTGGSKAADASRYNIARAEFLEGTRDELSHSLPEFIKNGF